jgi:lipopolysaccharide biosynthesis regulator YciM
MDFDLTWLLLALPAAFALGWLASRLDLRQLRREHRDAPRAYFKGLSLLLSEQQDKAIDAFIEAVQNDPDTVDLHFALGGLFRRRGEFERAVRVHEHLLRRDDLSPADRDRARHALAQDYMKAGLFDRAEAAFRALEGSAFDTESRLARLSLYERSRDWAAAAAMGSDLEARGAGKFAQRIAHHQCELALEAQARGEDAAAVDALARAMAAAPEAPRPRLLSARHHLRQGRPAQALGLLEGLLQRDRQSFVLALDDYVAASEACGRPDLALQTLAPLFEEEPGIDLLRALCRLEGVAPAGSTRLDVLLERQPSLSAVLALLESPQAAPATSGDRLPHVRVAVQRAAAPLQRYRCAHCGFEAQRHFWQCPGCLSWDSFPPKRIEQG